MKLMLVALLLVSVPTSVRAKGKMPTLAKGEKTILVDISSSSSFTGRYPMAYLQVVQKSGIKWQVAQSKDNLEEKDMSCYHLTTDDMICGRTDDIFHVDATISIRKRDNTGFEPICFCWRKKKQWFKGSEEWELFFRIPS